MTQTPQTPVSLLLAVLALDGYLLKDGDGGFKMALPEDAPAELKADIRQRAAEILDLLGLTFVIVKSDVIGATCFWVPDIEQGSRLVGLGAEPGDIFTKKELELLINKRVKGADLLAIHRAKRTFNGRITPTP